MLVRVIISAILVLGLGQRVFAGCTCSMPGGGCGRGWHSGQVIFLGTVTADIETKVPATGDAETESSEVFLPSPAKTTSMSHAVHFSIVESFRGEGQPGQEIVVQTRVDERGPQDGDCSYPFVLGVSYLVYASRVGDSISTSTCTFTSPEVAVGATLRELRALRDGKPVESLFGTVSLLSSRAEPWHLRLTKMRPLSDVTVRAIDSAGIVRSTKTDERGVYSFEFLPTDYYRIETDLPTGLRILYDRADETLAVDLADEEATRVGCRADIRVRLERELDGTREYSPGGAVP